MKTTEKTRIKREMTGLYESYILEEKECNFDGLFNICDSIRERGVTLIALIVTIIVLLILAGVSLNIVLGDNGIIKQAQISKNEYEDKVKDTQEGIDGLYNELIGEREEGESIKVTTIKLDPTTAKLEIGDILNLTEGLTIEPENATNNRVIWRSSNPEVAEVNNGTVTALAEGEATIIVSSTDGSNVSATCTVTVTAKGLPSTDTTKPYLPGDDFQQVPGTDLDNGLVIEDEDGNQYVWIEVPQTAEVYPTAGLNITEFTSTEYTAIENDLQTYTDYYRRDEEGTLTKYKDKYFENDLTGKYFKSEGAYNDLKQKMYKSVYENGGFWIGRYEAGKVETTTVPVSKAEQPLYNKISRMDAQTLATQVNSGNYTSSLMFGVQWDLVMKFLETKGVATQEDLRSDSSEWGNYEGKLLNTGSRENFKKMNVYDLAGNVCEWTLEYSSNSYSPCAMRGGNYSSSASKRTANYRSGGHTKSENRGFRVTFF